MIYIGGMIFDLHVARIDLLDVTRKRVEEGRNDQGKDVKR